MRILIINSVYGYGSTGKIVREAASFLRKEGHEVVVAYGRRFNDAPKEEGTTTIGGNCNILISGVKARLLDKDGFVGKAATSKFLKWADSFSPDVVWAHNLHGYYFNVELLFKWLKCNNAKLVWTLHDCWTFTGHCAHYSASGCKEFMNGCVKCPHKELYPKAFFSRSKKNYLAKKRLFTSLFNRMVLVTPSAWLGNEIKRSYLSNSSVKIIHNGIDLDLFRPTKPKRPKTILCVANIWTKNKGLNDVVELSKIIDPGWRITLIGDLPQGTTLPPSINYLKRTDSKQELIDLYSSSKILFNPTYEDNFPTVNIEAIACQCVPVCYRTGGIPEIVPKDFLVKPGDYISAYEIMKRIDNGALEFDYSNRDELSKETTYRQYEDLFLSLLKR